MADKPKPESKITYDCDGSVSCVADNQNQNKSAGSSRQTERGPSIVRRGERE
jgi:hypothetical protein